MPLERYLEVSAKFFLRNFQWPRELFNSSPVQLGLVELDKEHLWFNREPQGSSVKTEATLLALLSLLFQCEPWRR